MAISNIDLVHDALNRIPSLISEGGSKNPGVVTAYYVDVPKEQLPPAARLTQAEYGYRVSGIVHGRQFAGQAIEGSTPGVFRRVILSFVQEPDYQPLH